MPDLIAFGGSTPTFSAASARFGTGGLDAGGYLGATGVDNGLSANGLDTVNYSAAYTIEGWIKIAAVPSTVKVWASRMNWYWLGVNNSGMPVLNYQYAGGQETLTGTTSVCDGQWHHIAFTVAGRLGSLWVDGVRIATGVNLGKTGNSTQNGGESKAVLGRFGSLSGYEWTGSIDEVRYSTVTRYTGDNYTVPTAPFAPDASTAALFHLESSGADANVTVTAPGAPTNLVATAGSAQATLSWTAPTSTGGAAINDYVVQQSTDGTNWTTFADGTSTSAGAVVTGLTNGTAYTFRVAAVNTAGTGAYSATASATPAAAPSDTTAPTVPGTPTAAASNASATVTFAASTDAVGVTGYRVYSSADGYATPVATGASSPITVGSLTNGTAYTFQVAAYDAAGNQSAKSAASNSVTPAASTAIAPNDGNIKFSPYTWHTTSARAKTICAGASFVVAIDGTPTSLNLLFDMTDVLTPLPKISYRIDNEPFVTVPLAASIAVAIPTGNSWPTHTITVVVEATTQTKPRWDPQNTAVKFLGISSSSTITTRAVSSRRLRGMVFGDSITEGVRTLNSTATADVDRNSARVGWAFLLGEVLGAEVGVIGFGSQGVTVAGTSGVPAFPDACSLLWAGQARDFSTVVPDFIVINQGTNDGGSTITAGYTAALNTLLAATPSSCRIVCLRPFGNANQAANIQAAIAACSAPGRCTYVDTAGWFSSTDASDSLHPYGYVNVAKIAPLVAGAVRDAIGGGATYTKRADGSAKPVSPVRV